MMSVRTYISALTLSLLMAVIGCESDYSYRGDATAIAFSADTLSFDTVFTGEATTTTSLMIYNKSDEDMTLDKIWLEGGSNSSFNVNINGSNATEMSGIHLRSGDSLYVFVNVFPQNSDEYIYELDDNIIVQAGHNMWSSHLKAYGLSAIRVTGHISEDAEWTSDKPYLLSGTVAVDSSVTLTIDEGTQIFLTEKAGIDVYGTLITKGTHDNMVRFRSSRTEEFYSDIPGQWYSIMIMLGSGRAKMDYTEIANSTYGLLIDSLTELDITNSIIRDATYNALITYAAKTNITNCLLYNCGSSLFTVYGGDVVINHCTMSNFYRWHTRSDATVFVTGGGEYPELGHVTIANCVVAGNQSNEMEFSDAVNEDNCLVTHCYMRLGTKWEEDTDPRFDAVIVGKDPGFVDRSNFDFHIVETSDLIGLADPEYSALAPYDFDGICRTDSAAADIGAFQYVTTTE